MVKPCKDFLKGQELKEMEEISLFFPALKTASNSRDNLK